MTRAAAEARLRGTLEAELSRKVLPEAYAVEARARELHGSAIGPVLFYGSCQRAESAEGVLDAYLLSTSNKEFHESAVSAGLNWLVPPTVYFYSLEHEGAPVRAKVAAITSEQFGSSCRDETPSVSIWARFCQPAVLLGPLDDETMSRTVTMLADAVKTAARWAAFLGPEAGTSRDFWVQLFLSTYGAELRPERSDRAALIYETHAERYDQLLLDAWGAMGIPHRAEGEVLRVQLDAGERADARRRWRRRALAGKGINLARIAKGTLTFDGGVDYLLWKIERHSGVNLEVTDWQKRHPFLASPVVLAKLVRSGAIR